MATCHFFLVSVAPEPGEYVGTIKNSIRIPTHKGHCEEPEHLTMNLTSKVKDKMSCFRLGRLLLDLANTQGPFRTRFACKESHYEVLEHLTLNLTSKVKDEMSCFRRGRLLFDLGNSLGPFRTKFEYKI